MTDTTTAKIAELNDLCRKAMGVAGKVFQTCQCRLKSPQKCRLKIPHFVA